MRKAQLALLGAALATASWLPFGGAAFGAESEAASDKVAVGTLEELVVQARRKTENLQDVPVATTAISAESLRTKNISSINDVALATPSLTVNSSFSATQLNFSMRGQTPQINSLGVRSPTVQLYFNDVVPITASPAQFYDLSSVQVLRGPQGTLFGRSALGGAVLFVPAAPGDEYDGFVTVKAGNLAYHNVETGLTLPLFTGASLRLAGNIVRRDGYTSVLNAHGLKLDGQGTDAFRATLLLHPTDSIRNTLLYDYHHIDQTSGSLLILAAEPNQKASQLAVPTNASYQAFLKANPDLAAIPGVAGGLQTYLATVQQIGPRALYLNTDPTILRYLETVQFVSDTLEVDVLGVKVKNILAYQKFKQGQPFNPDGAPMPIYDAAQLRGIPADATNNRHQLSEELQFQGVAPAIHLDWIVGGYYQQDKDDAPGNASQTAALNFVSGTANWAPSLTKHSTSAIFGQGVWRLTDRLNLTTGGRYTWDQIDSIPFSVTTTVDARGNVNGPSVCASDKVTPFNYSNPTACRGAPSTFKSEGVNWIAGLDYKLTDNTMAYVSSRQGFQPGGLATANIIPGLTQFAAAKTIDVEGGLKYQGNAFGVPARLNLAVYHEWLTNAQRAVAIANPRNGVISNVIFNAQKSSVTGVEGEAEFALTENIHLSGFASYTDATYESFKVPVVGLDPTDPACANAATRANCRVVISSTQDLKNNPFPLVSKLQYGATLQVKLPIDERFGYLSAVATYSHLDKYTFTINLVENPEAVVKPQDYLNGRIEWKNVYRHGFDLSLWGKNLTNKTYFTGGFAVQRELGLTFGNYNEPRTYGVELRYRFGAGAETR